MHFIHCTQSGSSRTLSTTLGLRYAINQTMRRNMLILFVAERDYLHARQQTRTMFSCAPLLNDFVQGEYAANNTGVNATNPEDGHLSYTTMRTSTAEAAFMIGLERNSDIVFASCYTPLIQQVRDFILSSCPSRVS